MYGLIKAANKCKSIIPVVVLSKKGMGDRLKGWKDTLKKLSHFFTDMNEAKEKVQFVFTGFIDRKSENDRVLDKTI